METRHGDGSHAVNGNVPARPTSRQGPGPVFGGSSAQSRRVVDRRDDLVASKPCTDRLGIVGRPLADQLFDLGDGQDLAFDQGFGQAFELVAVLFEQAVGAVVGLAEDAADFFVDDLRGVFGVVARLAHLAAQERVLLGVAEEDRADALAHAALGDHDPGQPGRPLQVVGDARPTGRRNQPFGGAAAHVDREHRLDVAPVIADAVFGRAGSGSRPGPGRAG